MNSINPGDLVIIENQRWFYKSLEEYVHKRHPYYIGSRSIAMVTTCLNPNVTGQGVFVIGNSNSGWLNAESRSVTVLWSKDRGFEQ